jgi:hypothetical protein
MAEIFATCFMLVFTACAVFPVYLMWKTDRELSKQIEELRKKLDRPENDFYYFENSNNKPNEH